MKKFTLAAVLLALAICLGYVGAVYTGIFIPNSLYLKDYPVRGVDVSHYQGDIDWRTLSQQGISFAFIKATEGNMYVDEYFDYNIAEARKAGLKAGAYHFFSFDITGEDQARNFISTIEGYSDMLPPVIDLELYGNYDVSPQKKEIVIGELGAMIDAIKSRFGKAPIIYATEDSYKLYLDGEFPDCPIWIRDVWSKPELPDGRKWTFWQYTGRKRLPGYSGEEKFIDMNVFCGTAEEFEAFCG